MSTRVAINGLGRIGRATLKLGDRGAVARGDPRASVVDLDLTKVVDGDLVKMMSWYDSEWGSRESDASRGAVVDWRTNGCRSRLTEQIADHAQ